LGLLKATYGGVEIPVKITRLDRNLTPSIANNTISIENINAGEFLYSTYSPKQIVMEFQIANSTARELSEFRRRMAEILHSDEPKRLIFSDEPTIYYDAIVDGEPVLEEDDMYSSGSITWLIPDGVAYSTAEFTFDGVQKDGYQTITIKNNGTEWADVDYEITHNHENGFIGIASKYGAIQLGKIEEADGEDYKASEILSEGYSLFQDDHGTSYQNPENTTQGALEVRNVAGYNVMALKGGQATSGYWNGGMRTLTIPVDSEGRRGAKNFYCYTQHWFETGLMGQTGAQTIAFLTGENEVICSMSINKSDTVGNTAHVDWFAPQNKKIKTLDFHPTAYEGNPFNLKMGGGHNDFLKEGDRLRIFWYGQYYYFTIPEIKDMACEKIQVWIGQWGSRDLGNQLVTHNYLKSIWFRKDNVEKYRDVPNRYKSGDVVYIDGNDTAVYVNGMKRMEDEIRGSKHFLVPPGETEIQFSYSAFSSPPPTIKAKIREAYL
jgi:predicted phage tail component-like protein